MARRRRNTRRGQGKRSRTSQRNAMRSVSRAVHFKPVRSRVTQDPPAVSRTLSGSVVFPILISVKTKGEQTSGFESGDIDKYSYLQLGRSDTGTLAAASIAGANISAALFSWMQWKNDARFETSWALKKVSLWGPNPYTGSPHYRDAEIGLRVDLGDISNALELHDCGTTTRRPCVAMSMPYSIWMDAPDASIVTVFPDAAEQPCDIGDGAIWGRLHLALDWRRGPSSLFTAASTSRNVRDPPKARASLASASATLPTVGGAIPRR